MRTRVDLPVILFPESAMNQDGYEKLQKGATKKAIEIFKLNEIAYPRSARNKQQQTHSMRVQRSFVTFVRRPRESPHKP